MCVSVCLCDLCKRQTLCIKYIWRLPKRTQREASIPPAPLFPQIPRNETFDFRRADGETAHWPRFPFDLPAIGAPFFEVGIFLFDFMSTKLNSLPSGLLVGVRQRTGENEVSSYAPYPEASSLSSPRILSEEVSFVSLPGGGGGVMRTRTASPGIPPRPFPSQC